MFFIIVESNNYDNVNKNDVIQYCNISKNNKKKIVNTKLIIKSLARSNLIRIICFNMVNSNKKTIYQLFRDLYYDKLYKVVANELLYKVTIIHYFIVHYLNKYNRIEFNIIELRLV